MTASTDGAEVISCIVKILRWIPVLFILTIVFWSYYAYVYEVCVSTVEYASTQIVYLIIFHLLFLMFMWSYWQTIFTKSNYIPDKFKLPPNEYETLIHAENEDMQRQILEDFSTRLPNCNRTISGSVRYCEKCRQIKPDRSHHCSVCRTCILKMDHHCPWVNNCIGFKNYKFFVLFLAYALIMCVFAACTSMQYVIKYWHGGKFQILFLFFVALMFAISLISLFSYHCFLVVHNRTTLEAFRAPIFSNGPDKEAYNMGKCNNFHEVFGDQLNLWPFPVGTSLGCGFAFPRRLKPADSEHLLRSHDYSHDEEKLNGWISQE